MMVRAVFFLIPPAHAMTAGHPGLPYYVWSFSHWSYSDVVALYGSRHLYQHGLPYFHNVIEYPVLLGLFMSAMAYFPGFGGYVTASVMALTGAFGVGLWVLWRARGPRTALWYTLSPMLATYGLLNWDLLGIATWGLGLWAFERGRDRQAGLWIGVGIATKFFPIVMVPYLGAALWMAEPAGRRHRLRVFLMGLLITAVGINLPFALLAFHGWSYFFTFNSGRGPDPGIYQWLIHLHLLTIAWVNLLSLLLTVAGGSVILAAVLKGRLPAVSAAAAALAWWMLCNKVYSPQYMLWVYYALLWTDQNPWQLVVMNVAGVLDYAMAMRWLALGTTGSGLLPGFEAVVPFPVITLRDIALAWSAVSPWRRDLSRASGRFFRFARGGP